MNDKLAEDAGPGKPLATNPRRPYPPTPIEPFELRHPAVPPGAEGVTILHIADLHVRRGRPRSAGIRRAAAALAATTADLAVLCGDYMNYPGDERATLEALAFIAASCRTRHGVWAIFGNHDSWEFVREARKIPGISWMEGGRAAVEPIAGVPLTLVGTDEPEDLFGIATRAGLEGRPLRDRFCIALAHYPTEIYTAAALGISIVLAGHTHGGQFRAHPRFAPHTSCDLPAHLAAGVLRVGDTVCCISRGLGQAVVELRLNCPVQLPLYTLRRGQTESPAIGLGVSLPW